MIIDFLKKYIKLHRHRNLWRKKNKHNGTRAESFFDINNVIVGMESYGRIYVDNNDVTCHLSIGNYVSIGNNVVFLLGVEHRLNTISTYPFRDRILNIDGKEAFGKGDIIVDDDVWIGYGVTILSGVHIGQGAVVASGAVVCKDVPPYSIVGGVPAEIIKYRFNDNIIQKLKNLDFKQLTTELILNHENELYTDISQLSDIDIEAIIAWVPKKKKLL